MYCVYAHALAGDVFYVGCGNAQRPYRRAPRNAAWEAIVGDRAIDIIILGWYDDKKSALERERAEVEKCQELKIIHKFFSEEVKK